MEHTTQDTAKRIVEEKEVVEVVVETNHTPEKEANPQTVNEVILVPDRVAQPIHLDVDIVDKI